MTGVEIPEDAWNPDTVLPIADAVPVVDADDQNWRSGVTGRRFQQQLRGEARTHFAALPTPEFEQERLRDWDFGDCRRSQFRSQRRQYALPGAGG